MNVSFWGARRVFRGELASSWFHGWLIFRYVSCNTVGGSEIRRSPVEGQVVEIPLFTRFQSTIPDGFSRRISDTMDGMIWDTVQVGPPTCYNWSYNSYK